MPISREFGQDGIEREHFASRRAVIKIGSSTITEGATNENPLNIELIDNIARQSSHLYKNGVEVVIVSSGVVVCGRNLLSIEERDTQDRQVEAVFGQPTLIEAWVAAFRKYGVIAGQILVTENDLEESKEVLQKSLKIGVVIVNANDSVNKKEMEEFLTSADNDRLSGFVATTIDADTVLILTDVKGVFDPNNNLIEDGFLVNDTVFFHEGSSKGTGGMASKVQVLKDLSNKGVTGVITDTKRKDFILEILRGNTKGVSTIFKAN